MTLGWGFNASVATRPKGKQLVTGSGRSVVGKILAGDVQALPRNHQASLFLYSVPRRGF